MEESRGGNRLGIETSLTGFNARQREQVFCEPRHASRVLADDFEELASGSAVSGSRVEQSFGVALDGSQGCAEFMGNIGDKVATSFFHALSFGKVAKHRDGAAARQRGGSDI